MKYPMANYHLGKSSAETTMSSYGSSTEGYAVGFLSTKGLYLVKAHGSSVTIISRDGVAECVKDGKWAKARLIGVADTLQTVVAAPVGLGVHFLGSIACPISYVGCKIASPFSDKAKRRARIFKKHTVGNLASIPVVAGGALAAPVQIVAPEFTTKILHTHKWGTRIGE